MFYNAFLYTKQCLDNEFPYTTQCFTMHFYIQNNDLHFYTNNVLQYILLWISIKECFTMHFIY